MKVLPDWSHQGAVLGLMGGSDVVRRKWAHYKKYDLKIAAFWLQDWSGKTKNFDGNKIVVELGRR